jgi:hypothetical protein
MILEEFLVPSKLAPPATQSCRNADSDRQALLLFICDQEDRLRHADAE